MCTTIIGSVASLETDILECVTRPSLVLQGPQWCGIGLLDILGVRPSPTEQGLSALPELEIAEALVKLHSHSYR